MVRIILGLVLAGLCTLAPRAYAQVFTPQERAAIVAFPSEDSALDWNRFAERSQEGQENFSSSSENFLGAIVALRTGANDVAIDFSEKANTLANTEAERVRAALLDAFINYYTSPSQERQNHQSELVQAVGLYKDAGIEIDWLAGTSIEFLVEFALHRSDPKLSKQAIDYAVAIMHGRSDFRSRVWLINLNMKAAYSSALNTKSAESIRPEVFLADAVELINEAQKETEDGQQLELLRKLYYRSHTISGAALSRASSRGESYEPISIRLITRFHPEFQSKCFVKVTRGKKSFRPRRKYGTGGTLILYSVNKKGQVSFKSIIDAQPKRLMEDFMHSYIKKQAASMRVEFKSDVSGCEDGGELILPFILHWKL